MHIFSSILIYIVASDNESSQVQLECCVTADTGCERGS